MDPGLPGRPTLNPVVTFRNPRLRSENIPPLNVRFSTFFIRQGTPFLLYELHMKK